MVYTLLGHFDVEMTPFRKHPVAWSGVAVHAAPRHHSTVARHGKGRRDILPTSPHAPSAFSPVSPLSSSKWEGGERGEIEFKSRRSRSLARSLPRSRTKRVSFIHIIVASVRPSPERRRNDEMGKRILGNTPKAGKQGGRGASLRPSDNRFHDG